MTWYYVLHRAIVNIWATAKNRGSLEAQKYGESEYVIGFGIRVPYTVKILTNTKKH